MRNHGFRFWSGWRPWRCTPVEVGEIRVSECPHDGLRVDVAVGSLGDDDLERSDVVPRSFFGLPNEGDATPGAEGDDELATFEGDDGFVEASVTVEEGVVKGLCSVFRDVAGCGAKVGDGSNVNDEGITGDFVPEFLELRVGKVGTFDEDV